MIGIIRRTVMVGCVRHELMLMNLMFACVSCVLLMISCKILIVSHCQCSFVVYLDTQNGFQKSSRVIAKH